MITLDAGVVLRGPGPLVSQTLPGDRSCRLGGPTEEHQNQFRLRANPIFGISTHLLKLISVGLL